MFSIRATSSAAAIAAAVALSACSGSGVATTPLASQLSSGRHVMQVSRAAQPPGAAHIMYVRGAVRPNAGGGLLYHNGPVQNVPKVYIVFWGFGLNNGDPQHEQAYLTSFMSAVGGSSWLNTVTQYYSTSNGPITNPTGQLLGTWNDNSSIPSHPSTQQLANEAYKAAQHFNYFKLDASFVVATSHNHNSSGFGRQYCAWHSAASTSKGLISFTNMPYISDAGYSCGAGSVNSPGTLDGVSIVGGHELAESQTDPDTQTGWYDRSGEEIGDLCAWQNLQNTQFGSQKFPTQPLWSNANNGCIQ